MQGIHQGERLHGFERGPGCPDRRGGWSGRGGQRPFRGRRPPLGSCEQVGVRQVHRDRTRLGVLAGRC